MSYAVETKKRKFDRILEQLTEHSSPARSSLNTRNNPSTVSLLPAESESARKRHIPSSSQPLNTPTTTSLVTHYLPSDRAAFLERLETFREVTKWHVSSTEAINAAAWAKRGWTCIDIDLVMCGSCREQLLVQVDSDVEAPAEDETDEAEEDRYDAATEVHSELVKKFQSLIVNAHSESCPWRLRGCDSSVQRIEGLLNISNAISTMQARYKSILESDKDVPEVHSPQLSVTKDGLDLFRFEDNSVCMASTLAMAMCGWRGKGEQVLECRHCFRKLGMWLFKGNDPTMERLDPLESHLEYCPWRSPEAQETEISVAGKSDRHTEQQRRQLAGWELSYQAITKDNAKKGRKTAPTPGASENSIPSSRVGEVTPEQREKKMKDLLKRLKDIRKPFNVKSLLRKKDKSKT